MSGVTFHFRRCCLFFLYFDGEICKNAEKEDFNHQTGALHPCAGQNTQQKRGGALLLLCAPGEFWTWYGPTIISVTERSCNFVVEEQLNLIAPLIVEFKTS